MQLPSEILLIIDCFSATRIQGLQSLGYNARGVTGFVYPECLTRELPRQYSQRVAGLQIDYMSAQSSANNKLQKPDPVLMAIATNVYCGRSVVGSHVQNSHKSRVILQKLSGRRHRVLTTIMIQYRQQQYQRQIETMVEWKRLSTAEIDQFIDTGCYQHKIGGYLPAALVSERFVKAINGMPSNLSGLPLLTISNMLNGLQ